MIALIVFAVMVLIGIQIFSSFNDSATAIALSSTTAARMAVGNTSANSFAAFNLVSVGPIIFGAVIILGIVGLLYLRR